MGRIDSKMVVEVPDTPEQLSVGESSLRARGIEDEPSSSNQYLEPTARNYFQQTKNSVPYDFSGNNAAPVDGDFRFSHSGINQFISGTHDFRTTHSPDCSLKPGQGHLNDSGTGLKMIDLSEESSFPRSGPTSYRGPTDNEEKHLCRHNERNEISDYGKLGSNDFNGDNAIPMDDDFLFSQAKLAKFISGTNDIGKDHSHNSSSDLAQSSVLNSGTRPEMIDLSQESPSPLPYSIRHRGPRYKKEKYLSGQSERNGTSGYGKLDVRALNSVEDLRKEKGNSSNSSNTIGSSNNIIGAENIKCHASLVPSDKEKVIVQQLNSRTRNEQLHSRNLEHSFRQSIMKQNKSQGCISPCELINNNNSQGKVGCKELKNPGDQKEPSSFVRNQDTQIGIGYQKVSQSNHVDFVLNPRKNAHRNLVRNGYICPSNIARNRNDTKAKGIEEGGVFASKVPNANSYHSSHLDVVLHPKRMMLANNGRISSSNITRNNNNAKARGGVKIPSGYSSKFIHGSGFEGRMNDIGKGKEILNEELSANSQHIGTIPSSRRSRLIPEQELAIISEVDYDTSSTNGSGATHTVVESSSLPSPFATDKCMSENLSSHSSSSRVETSKAGGTRHAPSVAEKSEVAALQSGDSITQVQGCFKLASEARKRKNRFAHSNAGECSSSRMSYDRRSAKPSISGSRSIRSRNTERVDTVVAPVIQINELHSTTKAENHELSDESIAKTIQLESDEVLARQLQEQFYLESPPVRVSEVESTLEWSLFQEDEDLHASFRQNQFVQREASLPSLLGRRFRHPSARMTNRAHSQMENGIGHIRRHISRPNMSLEERLDFIEALEAAFENANDMDASVHFLDGQHDFDENDYEMLLALDDNNHHVGASVRQINNLPQSLIQNTDSQEACAICLETPSVGDTIRHLPCLHKFHKDCIDTWLRRKRSCPICKFGIT